jgi:hypothetical protein
VLVQVRDAQGVVLAKHIVGVGAIHPGDTRTFALHVEMHSPEASAHSAARANAARSAQAERAKPESLSSRAQDTRKAETPSPARTPSRPK